MTSPITIRLANTADVDRVTAIHAVARRIYYAAGGHQAPTGDGAFREIWARAQRAPTPHSLICAEISDQVVGFVAMGQARLAAPHDSNRSFELHALYVDPDHWGLGVGKRLHVEFRERLRRGGFDAGVLDVWDGNSRALGFYQRRGWTLDGRMRPGPEQSKYLGMSLPAQAAV